MSNFGTVHTLVDKLSQTLSSVLPLDSRRDAQTIRDSLALNGLAEEPDYIKQKRAESIAYLRSFTPSKYVLDGAKVDLYHPTILGAKDEL